MKKNLQLILILSLLTSIAFAQSNKDLTIEQFKSQYGDVIQESLNSFRVIPNGGQWDSRGLYKMKAKDHSVWVTEQGLRVNAYHMEEDEEDEHEGNELGYTEGKSFFGHVYDINFVGMNSNSTFTQTETVEGNYNYFKGQDKTRWATDLGVSKELWRNDVYNDIDMRYYAAPNGSLEYDFILAPNANPAQISMEIIGVENQTKKTATKDRFTAEGGLKLSTELLGDLEISKPIAYQKIDGQKVMVEASYAINSNGDISFNLGTYDPNEVLIIDPMLNYYRATFVSCSGCDGYLAGLDVDPSGDIYISGYSYNESFPTTVGSYDEDACGAGFGCAGNWERDVFVAKINANLASLVYCTFLGGRDGDYMDFYRNLLSVNAAGEVHVIAEQFYNGGFLFDYPYQAAPCVQNSFTSQDTYVLMSKLNAAGNGLIYSGYFVGGQWNNAAHTGAGRTWAKGLEVNSLGQLVMLCGTNDYDTWPVHGGAYQSVGEGGFWWKMALCIISPTGNLLYGTHFSTAGGMVHPTCLELDGADNIYVGGYTDDAGMPKVNPYQAAIAGSEDGFVVKFDQTLSNVLYSTYIGGAGGDDEILGITVNSSGELWGTGTAYAGFPTTAGCYDNFYNGVSNNGMYFKLDAAGNNLLYGSYMGGSGTYLNSTEIDEASGVVVLMGTVNSTIIPLMNAHDNTRVGFESFITSFCLSNPEIQTYGTYLGGNQNDYNNYQSVMFGSRLLMGSTSHSAGAGNYQANNGEYMPSVGGSTVPDHPHVDAFNLDAASLPGGCTPVLPANFLNIQAVLDDERHVRLKWKMGVEKDIEHYEVERSHDGIHFDYLTSVEKETGTYLHMDEDPFIGGTYYRIKAVGDGKHKYSTIVMVNVEEFQIVKLFPNPAINNINVVLSSAKTMQLHAELINALGQKVKVMPYTINEGQTTLQIDVQDIAAGLYNLKITSDDAGIIIQKELIVR